MRQNCGPRLSAGGAARAEGALKNRRKTMAGGRENKGQDDIAHMLRETIRRLDAHRGCNYNVITSQWEGGR